MKSFLFCSSSTFWNIWVLDHLQFSLICFLYFPKTNQNSSFGSLWLLNWQGLLFLTLLIMGEEIESQRKEIMPSIMQCLADIWHIIDNKYLLLNVLGIKPRNAYLLGRHLITGHIHTPIKSCTSRTDTRTPRKQRCNPIWLVTTHIVIWINEWMK